MSRRRYLRNVTANWVTMVWSIGWGIVMVPLFLRVLGRADYGIWILVTALTGYLGTLDLGVHNAAIRHIARAMGRKDPAAVNRVLNTAFWIQSAMGAAALVVAVALASILPGIEGFAASRYPQAALLLFLAGAASALTFAGSTFRGVLVAAERFDLTNLIRMSFTAIQNIAFIIALSRGPSLVTLAAIGLIVTVLEKPLTALVAFRVVPGLRFDPSLFDRGQVREIFGYGMHAMLVGLGSRLRFFTDSIVIASFLPAAAITVFNMGSRPLQYLMRGIRGISGVLTPAFSRTEAADESGAGVARLLILATRTTAILASLGCLVLAIAGDRILDLWLGQHLDGSYLVLLILVPAYWMETSLAPTGSAVLATRAYRFSSATAIGEGVANLVLSLLLVGPFGLVGVALGTAIPMVFARLFVLPAVACRVAGLSLPRFLAGVWAPALPAVAVAGLVGRGLADRLPGSDLLSIGLIVGGMSLVYGTIVFLILRLRGDELLPPSLRGKRRNGPAAAAAN